MMLSIIVLSYKKSQLTIDCIDSIFKNFKGKFEQNYFELIVVDNDSGVDTVEKIKNYIKSKNYKNVNILENHKNLGFGMGVNVGVKSANGEVLLFLNNDTVIGDSGIERMVYFMNSNSTVAILGGKLTNPDGSEQASIGKFYNILNVLWLLIGMQRFGLSDRNPVKIKEVDWVKGGLMMIRKSIFEKLGGFDENIFMYIEDMELCYRAKKHGYKTFFYPDISVIHHDQGSSSRTFAVVHIYKGMLYFFKKHKSIIEYSLVKILLITKALIAIAVGSLTKNKYLAITFRKAIKF